MSMLTFILLIVLASGFIVGLKRGFILQFIHLISFFVAFIIAVLYYKDFAGRIQLWIPFPQDDSLGLFLGLINAEQAFYNGLSFIIIFLAAKIFLYMTGSMLNFVSRIPVIKQLNKLAGGILGFLEVYLITFLVLYILALLPGENIQSWIEQSALAKGIIENTPLFSRQIYRMWF